MYRGGTLIVFGSSPSPRNAKQKGRAVAVVLVQKVVPSRRRFTGLGSFQLKLPLRSDG